MDELSSQLCISQTHLVLTTANISEIERDIERMTQQLRECKQRMEENTKQQLILRRTFYQLLKEEKNNKRTIRLRI